MLASVQKCQVKVPASCCTRVPALLRRFPRCLLCCVLVSIDQIYMVEPRHCHHCAQMLHHQQQARPVGNKCGGNHVKSVMYHLDSARSTVNRTKILNLKLLLSFNLNEKSIHKIDLTTRCVKRWKIFENLMRYQNIYHRTKNMRRHLRLGL